MLIRGFPLRQDRTRRTCSRYAIGSSDDNTSFPHTRSTRSIYKDRNDHLSLSAQIDLTYPTRSL